MTSVAEETRFGGGRSVVIGGGFAGLLAARVLADHFDEVVVVERDALVDGVVAPRKGVPQGRHAHVLLARGEQVLGRLFPDLVPALEADGAVRVDAAADVASYQGGWMTRFRSGVTWLGLSRPLLESHVRRRVFARTNVSRRDAHDAVRLHADASGGRVIGVTVKDRERGVEAVVEADLVVDAAGRGTKLPAWLDALGFGKPGATVVKVDLGYATRAYRRAHPWPYPWEALRMSGKSTATPRIGALLPIEGGFLAILGGVLGDHPPADPDGFRAFARTLPQPDLYRALGELTPCSDAATFRVLTSVRRHYETMPRFPEGLAALGDALATFNPFYAQGMTVAALAALALGDCLVEQRRRAGKGVISGLSRRYLAAASRLTDVPWKMAMNEDLRLPKIEGERPPLYRARMWYAGQVHRVAQEDTDVYGRYLRVAHLLEGPETLLTPSTAVRVLRALIRRSTRSALPDVNHPRTGDAHDA